MGFAEAEVSPLPLSWHGQQPEDVLELLYKSTVRVPMVLNVQPDEVKARIHQAILEGAEHYRTAAGISVKFLAKLMVTHKPLLRPR